MQKATIEELVTLDDIAEITATDIHHYFNENYNIEEINALLEKINIESMDDNSNSNGYFAGKRVVLTGTLGKFSRTEAEEIIEKLGGKTSSSVTSQTSIVLVGENAGSKLDKAKALGIKIMYEDEFLKIIN